MQHVTFLLSNPLWCPAILAQTGLGTAEPYPAAPVLAAGDWHNTPCRAPQVPVGLSPSGAGGLGEWRSFWGR